MKEVTILGKGESLKKLDKLKTESKDVILINEFWKTSSNPCDYYKESPISDFIEGKNIYLLSTPSIDESTEGNYKNFIQSHNIVNSFCTVWASGSGTDRDRSAPFGWNPMPKECLDTYKYVQLSGNLRSGDLPSGPLRGSGAWAILLAAKYFDADIINIVGMDFYETQYLYKPTNVPDYTHSKEHVDKLKYDFSVVFGYFDTIQFNIFTLANYNPNLENVNIL
jgi:hypothetical protein